MLTIMVRDGVSALGDSYALPPFKWMALPSSGNWGGTHVLNVMQMNASPGFLADDQLFGEITLERGASLHLHTQSFARVLSMDEGQRAEQHLKIHLEQGSRLCFVGHPLVLHVGADFRQYTQIHMAEDCELIWGEIVTSGRRLNDEHFAFARLSAQTRIYVKEQIELLDNIQWQPDQCNLSALGQMERFSHQAGLYCVNSMARFSGRALYESLARYLDEQHHLYGCHLLMGVSMPSPSLLVVRGLAHHAELLQDILAHCRHIMQHLSV